MKDINTKNVSSSYSRYLSTLIVLCLSTSVLIGQKARTIAYEGMKAAKDGTFLVVIESQEKNLVALDKVIANTESKERKAALMEERENKIEFREIYKASAKAAFEEDYTFGKYQLVMDNRLKEVRDSLELLDEPYIMLIRRQDVRELGVLNSNNERVPSPFPQYFDGFAANLGNMYRKGETNLTAYKDFFKTSITKLNGRMDLVYYKLENKAKMKALKKERKERG